MKMWAPRREYDEYKAMMKETRERSAKLRKALIAASTTVAVIVIPAVDALAKLPGPKRW